jgi:hypothetical protein
VVERTNPSLRNFRHPSSGSRAALHSGVVVEIAGKRTRTKAAGPRQDQTSRLRSWFDHLDVFLRLRLCRTESIQARRQRLLKLRSTGHEVSSSVSYPSTRTAQIPNLNRNRSIWATTTGTFVSSTSRRAWGD